MLDRLRKIVCWLLVALRVRKPAPKSGPDLEALRRRRERLASVLGDDAAAADAVCEGLSIEQALLLAVLKETRAGNRRLDAIAENTQPFCFDAIGHRPGFTGDDPTED